ncbi:hypothetical protein [Myceligenerans pegani]|uniref:Restriction endonuclease n=1 Tax=Myceligenerans pegani TaxID=2776917 RepID=A0ABR9MVU4_9MICO|nr:hypothetical protein [Myceligenerans sp. TRM 65318]MBE1875049.1 hypothetical protein [Myceligenerans sp. TRM 65318]MBE3017320.1 hypothetical protein [Myceligenerans sp. TRM 65318]
MLVTPGCFTTYRKESNPLSRYLDHHVGNRALLAIGALAESEIDLPDDVILERVLGDLTVEPPAFSGEVEMGAFKQFQGPSLEIGPSTKTDAHVQMIAFGVVGDASLLLTWPDAADDVEPIDPFDGDGWAHPLVSDDYDEQDAMRRFEFRAAQERFTVGEHRDVPCLWFRLHIDPRTYHEGFDHSAHKSFVDEQIARVRPIVDRIASQINEYRQTTLPAKVVSALERRRSEARNREAFENALSWPLGFPRATLEVDLQTAEAGAPPAEPAALQLLPRGLTDTTFADIVVAVRRWANGAQRYPRSFHRPQRAYEDWITDQICIALNMLSAGGADREVFRHVGKTDITVRMKDTDRGTGEEVVFVCECKWWGGEARVRDDLDQLLGYLGQRHTTGMLIYFVANEDLEAVEGNAIRALTAHDAYIERVGEHASWPVLRFQQEGRRADVCVAFVHLHYASALRAADDAAEGFETEE